MKRKRPFFKGLINKLPPIGRRESKPTADETRMQRACVATRKASTPEERQAAEAARDALRRQLEGECPLIKPLPTPVVAFDGGTKPSMKYGGLKRRAYRWRIRFSKN
jgi:hypothetical protein